MDKQRYITFLLVAMMILVGHGLVMSWLYPPAPPDPLQVAEKAEDEAALLDAAEDTDPKKDVALADAADAQIKADREAGADREAEAVAELVPEAGPVEVPHQRISLGSMAPDSPYRMLVTFDNRGAAVVRLELNNPRYHDIDVSHGYLGNLSLENAEEGGCRITTVGGGTPAATAESHGEIGLRGDQFTTDPNGNSTLEARGDRIVAVDGVPIDNTLVFVDWLQTTKPKQTVELTVLRDMGDGREEEMDFAVRLANRPLQLIRPEPELAGPDEPTDPYSFLFGLEKVGTKSVEFDQEQIEGLPSLYDVSWSVGQIETDDNGTAIGVEFRKKLTAAELDAIGQTGSLELVKRFRVSPGPLGESPTTEAAGYRLTMEIEIHNLGAKPIDISYRLCGPTGLVMEGWWYSYKVHPTQFSAAGARDIVWRAEGQPHQLFVGSAIGKQAIEEPQDPETPLFDSLRPVKLDYVGTDTQYFDVVVMKPMTDEPDDPFDDEDNYFFRSATARPVGPVDEDRKKRTDVSFRLSSQNVLVGPNQPFQQRFIIFAGPKAPKILAEYDLDKCIVYGWFGRIAKPMVWLLHLFHSMVGNYGLAIIMLTVMVRSCMFPLGRKMALNAQKMQELAPEMKKIADTYKNDSEKRMKAQQELFKNHRYNPLSGCLPMFIQMPIFIGLYRGLSVDIALRQSPLIPGISWCSNLAGPDKLWYWRDLLPAFLSSETGWLGPFLNVLPLITGLLFMVQQKLFTPPPTDDQQAMQQQIMKFMMLFMVVIFHKVAAGLCLYFIASSLWGVGERLLLPRSKPNQSAPGPGGGDSGGGGDDSGGNSGKKGGGGNGAAVIAEKKKRRKKAKR